MFLRCVGKKPILSLSHSVCSDVLLLHLFLKRGLSVVVLWPFLSTPQSKHALSYWKQIWSWFSSNTVLVLHDIRLHCLRLVLLSTGSTFFFFYLFKEEIKNMLIFVSVLCCCSEQRELVPEPWLQLVPQSTAGKVPGFDCQLHSGFSKHICESTVRSSRTAQCPASDFKLV